MIGIVLDTEAFSVSLRVGLVKAVRFCSVGLPTRSGSMASRYLRQENRFYHIDHANTCRAQ